MKNGLLIGWMLLICIALVACGTETILHDSAELESIYPEHDKEEIVVWHTYSDEETRIFEKKVIPLFQKEHPHIEVKSVRQPHNLQLKQTLISRASSKRIPDVVRMDIAWMPEFAALQLLYRVDQFPEFDEIKSKMHLQAMATNLYEGHYYGLPLNMNTKAAIYNKELLLKAGYEHPPKDMKEVVDIALKHGYVIGMKSLQPWDSLPYFFSLGGRLTNSELTSATGHLNSPESIQAIRTLLNLYNENVLNPGILSGNADTWNGVIEGKFLMIDEGPWFYSILGDMTYNGKTISDLTLPEAFPFEQGNASVLGGENLVIMKGTKHLQASWIFLRWMSNQESQKHMFKTGLIPTNKKALENYPILGKSFIQAYVVGAEHAVLRPPVRKWEEIRKVYTNYMEKIFTKDMTVERALHQAAEEIDSLLEVVHKVQF